MARTETVCSRIKQSWLSISRMYNSEAINHDLTTSIGFILLNIDTKEGTPSTSIGPLMGMEATSLSRTLNTLERKGLIMRKKDENDARITRIFLTEKGKQKKDISKKTVKEFNHEVLERIGEEKLKLFTEVIEQISEISSMKKFNEA